MSELNELLVCRSDLNSSSIQSHSKGSLQQNITTLKDVNYLFKALCGDKEMKIFVKFNSNKMINSYFFVSLKSKS